MRITESDIQKLKQGEVVKLTKEASAITGLGDGIGGRTDFSSMEVAMRQGNPFRMVAKQRQTDNKSTAQFARLNGDEFASTWGDSAIGNDTGSIASFAWTQQIRTIAAKFPVRNSVLEDIPEIMSLIETDAMRLLYTQEGLSLARNNDRNSTTPNTGGLNGLRGFASYGSGSPTYGTDGYHNVNNTNYSLAATDDAKYDAIVDMVNQLPGQYWAMPDLHFMAHPAMITALRKLKSTSGQRLFIQQMEEGDNIELGIYGTLFGLPVCVNNNLAVGITNHTSSRRCAFGIGTMVQHIRNNR